MPVMVSQLLCQGESPHREVLRKALNTPPRWTVGGSEPITTWARSLGFGWEKGWVYSCKAGQIFLTVQNDLSEGSSPKATTPGLTTVAFPILDITLDQVLHPQLRANAALCDGVTVTMARTLQEAPCKEASGAEVTMEKRGSLASAVSFHSIDPEQRHLVESRDSYAMNRGPGESLSNWQSHLEANGRNMPTPELWNKSLNHVAET